jgi:hypothetical protein
MVNNVKALQAGHTQVTENHLYDLTIHTLAGAPEDMLPFYLEASTTCQSSVKQYWVEGYSLTVKHKVAAQRPLARPLQLQTPMPGQQPAQPKNSSAGGHIPDTVPIQAYPGHSYQGSTEPSRYQRLYRNICW